MAYLYQLRALIAIITIISIADKLSAVEVHFETPDSGFFLKHSTRPHLSSIPNSEISNPLSRQPKPVDQDLVLSTDRFTVVQTTQPVSIRASYGPFSTKQTVPARYIVPDQIESQGDHVQNATAALLELQQSNVHLDISAHLVRPSVPRDSPVLRVLFHAGADSGGHLQRQKICVLLHVSLGNRVPLKGRCMPEGEDGVCVAEAVVPSNWWPALPPPTRDGRSTVQKSPQRFAQVSYSVFEPPLRNPELCEPKVQIQPLTPFAQVPLVAAQAAYKELRADDTLTMLVPNHPLYQMSKFHVPVFLQPQPSQNVAVFIVRARVKAGMKILGATASSDQWNVSVEKENPKHTIARVTAFRKDQDPDSSGKEGDTFDANKVVEVFSWLLEVANDTKDNSDGGRIVWSVSYIHDGPKIKDASAESGIGAPEEGRKKFVAKLDINKDDIQAVLPISKNWELMNTAVLTGRQVSQAMKVFIVTHAGKVADVTLQSSCQAEDESVIKVSSSCSSVYVDGSEARGSSNASVLVKYGTYQGTAKFIVWMPEFPLEVSVGDFRLSQIKGWKVPEDHHHNSFNGKISRRKRAYGWSHHPDDFVNGVGSERMSCRARYQQSPVEVYARFLADDQDSGRISYLISRRTGLRVTDLVQPLLRVADPKIATLRGRTLQGRAMGRTDVQVLSPITGRVIGAKEIRVGSDKVSITRLIVRVVSGLQLTITPDNAVENGYVAETSVTRKLTAQYQEGLLDIDLEFSDGVRTPLRDVQVDDYFLLVESLDTEVVAFAPMLASHHPRVIAVGEGNGDLLRVTLLLSEECRMRRNLPLSKQGSKSVPGPLASALASVQVDFNTQESHGRSDTVQNDGISGRERKAGREMSDLADILIGIPLKDESSHEPTVQARQHRGGVSHLQPRSHNPHDNMTSLEIGMYVLLTAFCFAIVVFVVSCIVYASKFKPMPYDNGNLEIPKDGIMPDGIILMGREPRKPRESTTNAHDWVWLGRSTMDRSSIIQENNANGNGNFMENQRDSRIRITSNPINMNYADPDDVVVQVTSFDNPNHIELPSAQKSIDTSTYNKRDRLTKNIPNDLPPPPLPPHGVLKMDIECADPAEYKPPVPPHRNIGVTANIAYVNDNNGNNSKMPETGIVQRRHHHHPKHHRSSNNAMNAHRRSGHNMNNELQPVIHNQAFHQQNMEPSLALNMQQAQQYISAALFSANSPEQTYSPQQISPSDGVREMHRGGVALPQDLHMAERLVESAAQKCAFQFDTLTPKREKTSVAEMSAGVSSKTQGMLDSGIEIPEATESTTKSTNKSTASSSDDNGGFVTPPPDDAQKSGHHHQIKRATVVGNPMFSTNNTDTSGGISTDSELGPGESLGLDDLDMDYEQIMHYFDNLKESNA